jgi:hypothetical protein
MKFQFQSLLVGLIAGTAWMASELPTHALSFTTHYTGSDPKGDILLTGIEYDNQIRTDFSLVERANIVTNDLWEGGNTGAASADLGVEATIGVKQEAVTNEGVVSALGNLSLNSIIDTEDRGNFAIDVFFENLVDTVAFWERGMNSRLDVQALDADGNLIGNLLQLENSKNWDNAGFRIETTEIAGSSQKVGSLGIGLEDFGLSEAFAGLRVVSLGSDYKGPDWKVVGLAAEEPEAVPEPAFLGALGVFAFVASRWGKRQPKAAA